MIDKCPECGSYNLYCKTSSTRNACYGCDWEEKPHDFFFYCFAVGLVAGFVLGIGLVRILGC